MKTYLLTILSLAGLSLTTYAQKPVRQLRAIRTDLNIKIDGDLNDEAWKSAEVATDFTELRPAPGRKEAPGQQTEVRVLYDNTAIYVAAYMHEANPDSIAREIVPRDQVGNADFFGVVFDPYLDKINGNGFFITAAGSQFDAKYSQVGGEDDNWDAVWFSNVKINNDGWSAEFRIPYSALRFSSKDIQTWGVNFIRKRFKTQQQSFWNPLDPTQNGFINQGGELTNIQNIESPLRLSVSPYISSYVNNYPYNLPGVKNTTGTFNGGMDIKYGINQSFTLDMTLVPDFGQVQSDRQVLNLSPFEVQYNENRQFFTEGTELFSKGNLFYSRRVGSNPAYFNNLALQPGETVIEAPTEGKLLNATKVSGRTAKGLGIGVFNAVTNRMNAIVRDAQGNERLVENQPLTNYNIVVFDQSLKNNSSVSFINTNVLRQGSAYDANVSAVQFDVSDKKNIWNIKGTGRVSNLSGNVLTPGQTGYSYDLKFGKQSGKFVYNYLQVLTDTKYNDNDLSIMNERNFFNNSVFAEMNLYKGKHFNEFHTYMQVRYSQRLKPMTYQSFGIYNGLYVQFKNLWSINANTELRPSSNDFYEARNGSIYKDLSQWSAGVEINSNHTKRYSVGVYSYYGESRRFNGNGFDVGFYQNLRISNKFKIGNDVSYSPDYNSAGWAGKSGNQVIFSRFDRHTIENSLDANYTFNTRMGITLVARHYWSSRKNKDFYNLQADGSLAPTTTTIANADRNLNTFNIDMVYKWQFSPGSEFSIAWKDASFVSATQAHPGYRQNLDEILNSPQNNSLSFKVLYYLDYLQLKKKQPSR
ncbi:MAG: hypothetical protein K0S09_1731 [Sphingobacteriaceae bacterium]|jgi:hypothetical protein|nr:hypothetical protein [Sphingobacteriaceae bacterium]